MKTIFQIRPLCDWRILLPVIAVALLASVYPRHASSSAGAKNKSAPALPSQEDIKTPDACELVLAAQPAGEGRIERQIKRLQADIHAGRQEFQSIERIGWLYVAKARESFDPGYYKLAEQCALCLESRQAHAPEALLLQGHVLQNLHRFKEAEPLARELVARRGLSFDYGLLGDVLMEQGRLDQAAEAYQQMVDQRPDLEAYARISHLRWLRGDVLGATEVMRMAVSAASPRAAEPAAWVNMQLALLQFQQGQFGKAKQRCEVALDYKPEYAPALLLQGRLLLASGNPEAAVESLQRAARLNPLPDYLWVLSEGLRAAGRQSEAMAVESRLDREGAVNDPRTFSLYLSSRGEAVSNALELAQNELNTREDVFTHDALAWALSANRSHSEALREVDRALAEGTQDARLFFHAAVISARAGQKESAQRWLQKAAPLAPLLLPSEQKELSNTAQTLSLSRVHLPESRLASATLFTPASSEAEPE